MRAYEARPVILPEDTFFRLTRLEIQAIFCSPRLGTYASDSAHALQLGGSRIGYPSRYADRQGERADEQLRRIACGDFFPPSCGTKPHL